MSQVELAAARVDFEMAHQEYVEEATAHGATRERAEIAEAALREIASMRESADDISRVLAAGKMQAIARSVLGVGSADAEP